MDKRKPKAGVSSEPIGVLTEGVGAPAAAGVDGVSMALTLAATGMSLREAILQAVQAGADPKAMWPDLQPLILKVLGYPEFRTIQSRSPNDYPGMERAESHGLRPKWKTDKLHASPWDLVRDWSRDLPELAGLALAAMEGLETEESMYLSGEVDEWMTRLPDNLSVWTHPYPESADWRPGDVDLLQLQRLEGIGSGLKAGRLRIMGCSLDRLPERLDVHKLDLDDCRNITKIPADAEFKNLDLRDCPIRELPETLKGDAKESLELWLLSLDRIPAGWADRFNGITIGDCPALTELPKGIRTNILRLQRSSVRSIPDGTCAFVGIELTGNPSIEAVGENVRAGYLHADRCKNLKTIGAGMDWIKTIDGGPTLVLNGCSSLEHIGAPARAFNEVDARNCRALASLGDGFKVNWCLNLMNCGSLKTLPSGLKIGAAGGEPWKLMLKGTAVEHLPEDLEVKGFVSLTGCPSWNGELPESIKVKMVKCDDFPNGVAADIYRKIRSMAKELARQEPASALDPGGLLNALLATGQPCLDAMAEVHAQLLKPLHTPEVVARVRMEIRGAAQKSGDHLTAFLGRLHGMDPVLFEEAWNGCDNLEVEGDLDFGFREWPSTVPENLHVKGNCGLMNCLSLVKIGDGLRVDGALRLEALDRLERLPARLRVERLTLNMRGGLSRGFQVIPEDAQFNTILPSPLGKVFTYDDWKRWKRFQAGTQHSV